jgi:hypothetical protein
MNVSKRMQTLAVTAMLTFTGASHASFSAGNVVAVTYLYPDANTIYASATIAGPSDTIQNFLAGTSSPPFMTIQFTDTSITITTIRNSNVNNVAFDGLKFVDVNSTLSFFNYTLNEQATTYSGLTQSRVSYAPNSIAVNLEGLAGLTGQTIVLASPVPEAGTGVLALLGFVSIAMARLRGRSGLGGKRPLR